MKGDKASSSKKQSSTSRVSQSENIHSLNHLYQLASYSALQAATGNESLGNAVIRSAHLQTLTRKATLRLDATIKKSLCESCCLPLIPGLTSRFRVRAYPPTSRALETKCLLCSQSTRIVAPPSNAGNAVKLAVRHRKVRRGKEREHLLSKVTRIARTTRLNSKAKAAVVDQKSKVASPQHRSQRSRRRAGRCKARLLAEGREWAKVALTKLLREPRKAASSVLPRYTSRVSGNIPPWDKSWPGCTTPAEKEAIRVLRGNHLITSGLARGGATGSEMRA